MKERPVSYISEIWVLASTKLLFLHDVYKVLNGTISTPVQFQ